MRCFLICLLCVGVAVSSTAQEANNAPTKLDFDFIPGDAPGSVTIRDLSDLRRKILAMAKKTDGQLSSMLLIAANMGPSIIRDHLGLGQSLRETGSAALVSFGDDESFVLLMPITSVADAATAFEVNHENLAAGKLIESDKHNWMRDYWIGAKGKHIVLGYQRAVAKVMHASRLSAKIDRETQSIFANDDLFLTLDVAKISELIEEGELQPSRGVLTLAPNSIVGIADGELKRICTGLNFDTGFDGTFLFDFEGEESRKVLTMLQNESRPCNLNGLPSGKIVVAASQSIGRESGALIADAAEYMAPDLADWLGMRKWVAPQHVAALLSMLDEGARRVRISRAAVYRNEDVDQQGAFCLIGILDTDDGQEFIDELRELVPIVNSSLDPERDLDEQINGKVITKMVSFLAHDNRRARQFMTAKLRLLGRHALPALREVAKSENAQARSRAEALIEEIESDLSQQRAEFLAGKITSQLQPSFGYQPEFEQRGGQAVDAIWLKLEGEDQQIAPQLRTMLGPDWNKIRLARVDDQVIVMLGSSTALFEEAIEHLRSGSLGIGAEDNYAEFRRQLPGELVSEIHFSMAAAMAVAGKTNVTDEQLAGQGTSSMALSITPQQVRFDFSIPITEFNALKKLWE